MTLQQASGNQRHDSTVHLSPPASEWNHQQIRMAPRLARAIARDGGYGLTEVMVSSVLLAFVVASSTQVYVDSGNSLKLSSLRDSVNARIAEDLEELRRESWRWACEDGTEGGIASACTGQLDHADKPVSYKTGRSAFSTYAEIARYKQACGFGANNSRIPQTTAALMKQEKATVFPSGPVTLSWTKNLPSNSKAPGTTPTVSIQRTITVNSSDRNQLDVNYATSSTSPVQIALHSTLTPQALSWCP